MELKKLKKCYVKYKHKYIRNANVYIHRYWKYPEFSIMFYKNVIYNLRKFISNMSKK